MPEVKIDKPATLDILDSKAPKLSSTSDIPVFTELKVETKADATPDKVVQKEASEDLASPESEDTSAHPDEAKKPAKGVQKRIDELTRLREEANRRAEAADHRLDRALAALEKASVKETRVEEKRIEDAEPQKPVKTSFQDPDAYDAAIEDYVTKRAEFIARREVKAQIAEQARKTQEETARNQSQRVQKDFQERELKTREKYEDYEQIANSPEINVSLPMAYAILQSEQGPDIKYYLGKNPKEAERIASMTILDYQGQSVPDVTRQLVELGKLEARLSLGAPVAKPVSAAPKPITPLKTGETKETKSLEELDAEGMEAYAAQRRPQLAERRGPGKRL